MPTKKKSSSTAEKKRTKKITKRKTTKKKPEQAKAPLDSYSEWISKQVKKETGSKRDSAPEPREMPKDTFSEWLSKQPVRETLQKKEVRASDTYSEWMKVQVSRREEPRGRTTAIQAVQATALAEPDLRSVLPTAREIEIAVTGRKSGAQRKTPVWFVLEERKIFLLPTRGSSSNWLRNLEASPTFEISAGGIKSKAEAKIISEPSFVEHVAEKFREKYGAEDVASYYKKLDACVQVDL